MENKSVKEIKGLSYIADKIEELGARGSVYGLETTYALSEAVGRPDRKLNFIHIAGTNGKGSVSAYVSSVLRYSGYRTGLYTSPAVFSPFERISADGKEISRDDYLRIGERLLNESDKKGIRPTLFELETVMAFVYFAEKGCQAVVLETGLGGEEDSTNIIEKPVVSVITTISMDHTQILGEHLADIARAKAGIIKKGAAVCSAHQEKEAASVIMKKAEETGSEVVFVSENDIEINKYGLSGTVFSYKSYKNIEISLLGLHQPKNAALALEVLNILGEEGYRLKGLREGMKAASMPGRMEIIGRKPLFICDGAHNPQGARALAASIRSYFGEKKLIIILGIFKDKDYEAVAREIMPLAKIVFAVTPNTPRGLDSKRLLEIAAKIGVNCCECEVSRCVELAHKAAEEDDVILACGSFSYLGEVIGNEKNRQNT